MKWTLNFIVPFHARLKIVSALQTSRTTRTALYADPKLIATGLTCGTLRFGSLYNLKCAYVGKP